MPDNFWIFFVSALIPLIIGAIWYHPKIFGSAWMRTNGFTEADLAGGNMVLIFGLSYLFGVLLSFGLSGLVIHQGNVFQMMMPDVMESGHAAQAQFNDLMAQYGTRHRSFGHGAIHGVLAAVVFALPLIGINALFERRGGKYIMIHLGYWVTILLLMGGLICSTLEYSAL